MRKYPTTTTAHNLTSQIKKENLQALIMMLFTSASITWQKKANNHHLIALTDHIHYSSNHKNGSYPVNLWITMLEN